MKNGVHLVISLVIATYAFYVFLVKDNSPTPGKMFASTEDLIHLGILAILFFAGISIFLTHLPDVLGKNKKTISIVILLLSSSIPIPIFFTLLKSCSTNAYNEYKDKEYEVWRDDRELLATHLINFLKAQPKCYSFTGEAETISLRGFNEYLLKTELAHMVTNGKVVCPWGKEVTFALDRNKDGFIEFLNQKKHIRGVNPENPNTLRYDFAVSVSLSHKFQTSFHDEAYLHHITITE